MVVGRGESNASESVQKVEVIQEIQLEMVTEKKKKTKKQMEKKQMKRKPVRVMETLREPEMVMVKLGVSSKGH